MEKSIGRLEHNDNFPSIIKVDTFSPFEWLGLGWQDLKRSPVASLSYGLLFAVAGWVILAYAANQPYLFTAAVSGFLLLGPLLAAGLYELSRRHASGEAIGFGASLAGWERNGQSMFYMGVLLAIVAIAWERLSAVLFGLFYQGNVPDFRHFLPEIFLSGSYTHFASAYLLVGGALAVLVYALSAVAIPMLMDREVNVATAMMTSLKVISRNLGAMAIWAVLILVLTAIAFATWLVAMIVILPLLGHATWHAYRQTVG